MTNSHPGLTTVPTEAQSAPSDYENFQERSRSTIVKESEDPMTLPNPGNSDIPSPTPGFLGPTSFSAVFTEGQSEIHLEDQPNNRDYNIRGSGPSITPELDSPKVKEGAKVLSLLVGISEYTPAILEFYQVQPLDVMAPYILDCISMLALKPEMGGGNQIDFATSSYKTFQETSTPSPFNLGTQLQDLPKLLVDGDLCWEIVGLMLAAAGLGAASMVTDEHVPKKDWRSQARKLLHASDRCISYFEEYGHLTTIGVSLIAINFILHTQVYGDSDFHCWRKLGNLATATFALGLHEDPNKLKHPFWLSEIRKKLFWFAYISDKLFATFFGRPPLINGKFCSCTLPLDIETCDLKLAGEAQEQAVSALDPDGWSGTSIVPWTTLLRASATTARLREEVLEISLGTDAYKLEERALRNLKERLRKAEESLPSKLRDHAGQWVLEKSPRNNFVPFSTRLGQIYNIFLLERALVKRLQLSSFGLINAARRLLSLMLVLIGNRHCLGQYTVELPWLIALYALPPAGVLALELLRHSRHKTQAKHDFPRSEIVQSLSQLTSSIDYVLRPTDGNFAICNQAKKTMLAILDTVLSPEQDQTLIGDREAPDLLEMSAIDNFDEQTWLKNLDIDFWTSLEDHPLLTWAEPAEQISW